MEVDQNSLIRKESAETDTGSINAMKSLQDDHEEKKPEIIINSSDLTMVINATHLARQAAIDLIQSTNGDIKEALRAYINK